jgi:hypothetical protein
MLRHQEGDLRLTPWIEKRIDVYGEFRAPGMK